MLIVGLGQYPNLGVTDAFALLRRGSAHRVVRASRELGADRMNTRVGPFGVEVLVALERLRVVLGPNEHGLAFDLTWEGSIPPQVEPQHFLRSQERVVFDSKRVAQTGRWTGSITVDGETLEVTPDRWWGIRDRSWGIRGRGARAAGHPVAERGHVLLALRAGAVRGPRDLVHRPGGRGRTPAAGRKRCGSGPTGPARTWAARRTRRRTPRAPGTWSARGSASHRRAASRSTRRRRCCFDLSRPGDAARMWGMVDAVGRFDYDGQTGYGLYEYWALGDHPSFR
jgi:hypothetical protein